MGIRVAIASSDNIVVNQHFGHTQHFYIYEVYGEKEYHYIEDREVKPPCSFGEHDQNMLEEAVRSIHDCQYILCTRIGGGARFLLSEFGIQSYEIGDYIEDSLKRIWNLNQL